MTLTITSQEGSKQELQFSCLVAANKASMVPAATASRTERLNLLSGSSRLLYPSTPPSFASNASAINDLRGRKRARSSDASEEGAAEEHSVSSGHSDPSAESISVA